MRGRRFDGVALSGEGRIGALGVHDQSRGRVSCSRGIFLSFVLDF